MRDPDYEVVEFDPHRKMHAHYLFEPFRSHVMSDVRAAARELRLDSERVARLVFRAVEVEDELPNIVLSTLRKASEQISADVALRILEHENIGRLHSHEIVSGVLGSPGFPLYTLDELAELLRAFAEHLERNREPLLATGFPASSFSKSLWLHLRLSWLYPVKYPEDLGTRPLESGDLEYVFGWTTKRVAPRTIAILPYETAPLADGTGFRTAARIEGLRPKVLAMKIRLVRKLAEEIQERRGETIALDALREVTAVLTYKEVEFLLKEDAHHRNFGHWTGFIAGERQILPYSVAGGIAGIMDTLYHCERELLSRTFDQTRREVIELAQARSTSDYGSVIGGAAYYRALAEPWRRDLEALIQGYRERDQAAWHAHPWDAFAKRVDSYLEDNLEHSVSIRTRASKAHAAKLRRKTSGLLKLMQGSLEATGALPEISVGVSIGEADPPENVFRREGQLWILRYGGNAVHVQDSMGIRLISALLQARGKAISAIDLRAACSETRDLPDSGSAGPPLSRRDIGNYRSQVTDLNARLLRAKADADPSRASELESQINAIKEELRKGTGLRGQPRKQGDDSERARQAVRAAVSRALKVIDREHHDLWLHLKNSIKLGEICAYTPDIDPAWDA